jgi:hypothetical protein
MKNYTITTDYVYDDVSFYLDGFDREAVLPGFGFAEISNF